MNSKIIKVPAPAKINLCLDVIKKNKGGFHKIQTIFCALNSPADEIQISEIKNRDHLSMKIDPKIRKSSRPVKAEENLCYKALKLIKSTFKIKKFAKIIIKKNIPIASGLGGASSDAAATLKGLNKLWNLKLSTKALQSLAAKLGADVPFFIEGGVGIGENYGEKTTPLPKIKNIKFTILTKKTWPKFSKKQWSKPLKKQIITTTPLSSSTKTAGMYASLDLSKCNKNSLKTAKIIKTIKNQNSKTSAKIILQNLHNDFEILYTLPKTAHLSGSGPAIFSAKILKQT